MHPIERHHGAYVDDLIMSAKVHRSTGAGDLYEMLAHRSSDERAFMQPTEDHRRRTTVLVTGASGGIGADLCQLFARDGYDIVLVARNEGNLHRVASELTSRHGITTTVLVYDLAQATAPQDIYDDVQRRGITVDVLINNAGFGGHSAFVKGDPAEFLRMLQVNVVALTHLTRLFLPGMVARRSGRIMNVASTAAFLPGPFMAVYYASKAYVLSLSEALSEEVRGTGVTVTALCPGATTTNFQARAGLGGARLFSRGLVMPSQHVARIGYRGLMAGKPVVVTGFMNRLAALGPRIAPRWLLLKVVRRLHEHV